MFLKKKQHPKEKETPLQKILHEDIQKKNPLLLLVANLLSETRDKQRVWRSLETNERVQILPRHRLGAVKRNNLYYSAGDPFEAVIVDTFLYNNHIYEFNTSHQTWSISSSFNHRQYFIILSVINKNTGNGVVINSQIMNIVEDLYSTVHFKVEREFPYRGTPLIFEDQNGKNS